MQSGFRRFQSAETALVKVQSDILMSMDRQEITLLVPLDLSAAFDAIDHQILLNVIQNDLELLALSINGLRLTYLAENNVLLLKVAYLMTST